MAREKQAYRQLVNRYYNTGVDPQTAAGFGDQATMLYGNYRDTLALLRHDRGQAGRTFRQQRSDIRTQRTLDVETAAADAAARGMLGSSSDVLGRQAIRANAGSQIAQARDALVQSQETNLSSAMQARREFQSGLMGLAANRTASRANAAALKYLEKAYDQGGGGGGRGGWNGGGGSGGGNGGGGGKDKPNSAASPVPLSWDEVQGAGRGELLDSKDAITRIMQRIHRRNPGLIYDEDRGPGGKFRYGQWGTLLGDSAAGGVEWDSAGRLNRLLYLRRRVLSELAQRDRRQT